VGRQQCVLDLAFLLLPLIDLDPGDNDPELSGCGRIVEYGYGILRRHHRLPSTMLVFDLKFRYRCQQCRCIDGFRIRSGYQAASGNPAAAGVILRQHLDEAGIGVLRGVSSDPGIALPLKRDLGQAARSFYHREHGQISADAAGEIGPIRAGRSGKENPTYHHSVAGYLKVGQLYPAGDTGMLTARPGPV
jgi:hypothetical protein